ncbi:hypothetical protein D6789_04670 [Candidatus Woesearchaeota archaeon]|nr:MAG: hypothetical protein D6789_04670 [Candidatus Woesearchaeota archaeon]
MKRKGLFFLLLFLIIIMALLANGAWQTERAFQEELSGVPAPSFFSTRPSLSDRPFLGSAEAPLTLIVFSDFRSPAARSFATEYLPQLKKDYIEPGVLRYYGKYSLLLDDIAQQTEDYRYAQALACVQTVAPETFFAVYDWLFTAAPEELLNIPERFAVPQEPFRSCFAGPPQPSVIQDAAETERFGGVGIRPRLYLGVHGASNTVIDGLPSYTRLKRSIRDYETQVGN